MTAKEYLSQARVLKIKIEQKKRLLEEMEYSASSAGAIRYDSIRVQGGSARNKLEEEAIKAASLTEDIRRDIRRYYAIRNEIIDTIHSLDNSRYILVLHAKWIDGESLERIAADMHYSFGHTKNLYSRAMRTINTILAEREEGLTQVIEILNDKKDVTQK